MRTETNTQLAAFARKQELKRQAAAEASLIDTINQVEELENNEDIKKATTMNKTIPIVCIPQSCVRQTQIQSKRDGSLQMLNDFYFVQPQDGTARPGAFVGTVFSPVLAQAITQNIGKTITVEVKLKVNVWNDSKGQQRFTNNLSITNFFDSNGQSWQLAGNNPFMQAPAQPQPPVQPQAPAQPAYGQAPVPPQQPQQPQYPGTNIPGVYMANQIPTPPPAGVQPPQPANNYQQPTYGQQADDADPLPF